MQSIRQSRHILRAVKAQIERDAETAKRRTLDVEKAEGEAQRRHSSEDIGSVTSRPRSSSSSSNTTISSTTSNEDSEPTSTTAHRTPTATTQYSARAALGHSLTGVHARDRRTHEGKGEKVFVVGWEGPDDPLNPRNWPLSRRISCTLQISLIAAGVGAASGIDATVLPQAAASLGVSEVAESLDTGMYLIGMGLGSLVAGPFSETFGRNAVYIGSMAVFMVWIMASGLAPNFGAQVAFRLLAGCSASTPLVCSGGSVADMFDSVEKSWAFPMYAIAAFGGPMLGAVMGAYIGPSTAVSWRWTEWTILMLSGVIVLLVFLLMPETYSPLLLRWKAKHLRRVTGDDRFRSEHEIIKSTLFSRLKVSMTRPFLMFTEPIILFMCLYLSVVYIVLFTFLVGWPYIFQDTYQISQGLSNILFLAMFIGVWFNLLLVPVVYRMTTKQIKLSESRGEGQHFNPEIRLWYAMLGPAVAIPISLFWMGWTASPSISIWSPILAAGLFGFGVTGVFICAYMYVIDSYEIYSASALTFTALVRYIIAGGMTMGSPAEEAEQVCRVS
ncbi:hypothetical protein M406DRAFT_65239 [Cryphonectria parasitica EP155]|uniref:Major facilitator superfamily (MFS) profile domain-containing protein n=1 Tax=Cryphonectria parasitica (strain ATCC 38755 / EP155) TaxID=660469 RepID=A0A9P4XZ35_CRYP1|nr:uncharacterized protein M406DRAFT_65239 [Cryphonectria parasitica EP155]KAF3763974.1 hypothetical protein M406DRAFT_65239 [Cryphonectria parasitica EP155]